MSEATTRADVKAAMENVANVGIIHDYERWAAEWPGFLNFFRTTIGGQDFVRGWTITCESFTQQQITYGNPGTVQRNYTYKVRGYFGLKDSEASEKSAIIVVEDVVETFNSSIDTDSDDEWNFPAHLTVFEPHEFGSALVHYAEITLTVTELT